MPASAGTGLTARYQSHRLEAVVCHSGPKFAFSAPMSAEAIKLGCPPSAVACASKGDGASWVRFAAVQRLWNQSVLEKIASSPLNALPYDYYPDHVRLYAVGALLDSSAVERVVSIWKAMKAQLVQAQPNTHVGPDQELERYEDFRFP